jgi:gamma-glutamylcyclotransferase (GGCT)/AIG2-like uncharacterized protein YtfP
VYGSLMNPEVLDRVLGHPHQGERLCARLRGHARVTFPGWNYPLLVANSDSVTNGVLILGLSEQDLQALDVYEVVGDGAYRRVAVTVEAWGRVPGSTRFETETYLAGPRFEQLGSTSMGMPRPCESS